VKKIVGISVGTTLAIITIAVVFVLFLRRRNWKQREEAFKSARELSMAETAARQLVEADNFAVTLKELDGREKIVELDGESSAVELPANSKDLF
jgi:hypothetical protein